MTQRSNINSFQVNLPGAQVVQNHGKYFRVPVDEYRAFLISQTGYAAAQKSGKKCVWYESERLTRC